MTTPTNQIQLRQILLEEITALRKGETTPERVNAISHASNIVLKSINQQIHYAIQRREKPFCDFITKENEPALKIA